MTRKIENYLLGLLTEECSEALTEIGRALRFGICSPTSAVPLVLAREAIAKEIGDVLGSIEFALLHDLLSRDAVHAAKESKLSKLLDKTARDNLGRQLAPQPVLGDIL